jgi:membrane protease YdiL (CAAX protease family)
MPVLLEPTIAVFEYLLILAGLGFFTWLLFHSAGRAARASPSVLPAWEVSVADFLFLAWLVVALGFSALVLLRLTIGATLSRLPEADTLQLVLYGSMFHISALLTWIFACWDARRRRALQGLADSPRARIAWIQAARAALLTFLASIPLLTLADLGWEPLLKAVGLPTEHQELVDRFVQVRSPVLLALMIIFALVVAPVSEELIFRAGLFRFLRTRAPRWIAFVASAGLFALLHANWVSFLPLCVLGLVFAVAYERTGSLTVPILAHALFNLNSLLLVLASAAQ